MNQNIQYTEIIETIHILDNLEQSLNKGLHFRSLNDLLEINTKLHTYTDDYTNELTEHFQTINDNTNNEKLYQQSVTSP